MKFAIERIFMNRRIIKISNPGDTAKIFGSFDANARLVEERFGVSLRNRVAEEGDSILIEGESEEQVNAAAFEYAQLVHAQAQTCYCSGRGNRNCYVAYSPCS